MDYEKVWKRLLKTSKVKDDCLLWTNHSVNTYGKTRYLGKDVLVHRLSYTIKMNIPYKDLKFEDIIMHSCRNTMCFNPEHLTLGTRSQNNYDDKIRDNTLQQGTKCYNSKLTESQATLIKHSRYPKGHELYLSQTKRAEKFGTTRGVVSSIDENRAWSHIPDKSGNIKDTAHLRKKLTDRKKKNREKEWTEEMFIEAKKKILDNSELLEENNKHLGTPCRIWKKSIHQCGYGNVSIFGINLYAHVLSCMAKNKKKKEPDMFARHLCGNKICVNSEHLEFGTRSQNTIDSIKNDHSGVKLSIEIAEEIRNSEEPYKDLAKKYGVSSSLISMIKNEDRWKKVNYI